MTDPFQMTWEQWCREHPAREVATPPERPWAETRDRVDAEGACYHMECTHGVACEVVRCRDRHCVVPKDD
jgi:hypothetical protein